MAYGISGATWGIEGPLFLKWYVVAAIAAVVVPALVTAMIRQRGPSPQAPRALTPPEVGALTSDYQALIASLSMLRAAGVLKPGGRTARGLTPDERARFDWFTRTVVGRLGSGSRPPTKASLMNSLSVAFAQLRSPLVDMGYLCGDAARRISRVRSAIVLAVAAVGIVRIGAGLLNGKPVLYLAAVVLVLLLAVPFVRRVPRRTARGSAELRRLSAENSYLEPRMRPSFTTYGPSSAGMSAALFGGAALLWVDPHIAAAMNVSSASGSTFSSDSGFSGGGSDAGGSSCSGGSSCGGGGGCGG